MNAEWTGCPALLVCEAIGNVRKGCYNSSPLPTVEPCLAGIIILLGRSQGLLTEADLEKMKESAARSIGFGADPDTSSPDAPGAQPEEDHE